MFEKEYTFYLAQAFKFFQASTKANKYGKKFNDLKDFIKSIIYKVEYLIFSSKNIWAEREEKIFVYFLFLFTKVTKT